MVALSRYRLRVYCNRTQESPGVRYLMMTAQSPKQLEPTSKMAPFKCGCGLVLGWTDGKMLAVGGVSFSKLVTCQCAGCGKHKTWRPCKPEKAA
jgi:hypothetical protein